MNVWHLTGGSTKPLMGPRDLGFVGPGDLVLVVGKPDPERDFGRWAGALGSAVIRGAEVRRAA